MLTVVASEKATVATVAAAAMINPQFLASHGFNEDDVALAAGIVLTSLADTAAPRRDLFSNSPRAMLTPCVLPPCLRGNGGGCVARAR